MRSSYKCRLEFVREIGKSDNVNRFISMNSIGTLLVHLNRTCTWEMLLNWKSLFKCEKLIKCKTNRKQFEWSVLSEYRKRFSRIGQKRFSKGKLKRNEKEQIISYKNRQLWFLTLANLRLSSCEQWEANRCWPLERSEYFLPHNF